MMSGLLALLFLFGMDGHVPEDIDIVFLLSLIGWCLYHFSVVLRLLLLEILKCMYTACCIVVLMDGLTLCQYRIAQDNVVDSLLILLADSALWISTILDDAMVVGSAHKSRILHSNDQALCLCLQ